MIEIKDKSKCCGCCACIDVCTHFAISLKTDDEGFWYPVVDSEKCIDCGLCEKVCPIINVKELKKNDFATPICYAAHHKNLEVRFDSTSGGIFSALAEEVYKMNGYVGGAVYKDDWSACHFLSNNKADLKRLRSSKYLQSNAESFYTQVKEAVVTGLPVLVCGTPCQMAALKRFLHKDYANLIIADFICHSVASPKAHRKYFDWLEEKYGSKVVYFRAKNKELGWRNLTKKSIFADGKSYYGVKGKDLYSRAYHSGMIDRLSCYECPFKGYPRISDITLADFWGVEKIAKELDNDTGTSAVLINSQKGMDFFNKISKRLVTKEVRIDDIEPFNPALIQPALRPNYDRNKFFKDLDSMSFNKLGEIYFPIQKPRHKLLRTLKSIAGTIKIQTRFKLKPLWQFIYLNFFHPSIHTNWKEGHLLYPTPYCIFDIHRTANIQVHGAILLGNKKFRKSKLESRFLFDQNSSVIFEGNFRFGYGCDVEVFPNAELRLGADSGGNKGLTLICGKKIHIGSHTFYGRDVSIRDYNGGHILALQGFKDTNPVIIGNMCWICSEAKILPGVKIGDGTVVGANSLVIAPLPPRVLASGTPAQIIDTEISWKH